MQLKYRLYFERQAGLEPVTLSLGIFLQFIVYLFVNQFIVNSLLTVRDKFLNIFST